MALLTDIYVSPPDSEEKTFYYDKGLPNLPVPSLSDTLTRYLDSVEPLVSEEVYHHTKQIVKEFQNGIGRELHKKLELRASEEKNWLEKWWENYAYLTNREPLLPNCNMVGAFPSIDLDWKLAPGKMNLFAARTCYQLSSLWFIFRKERYRPMKITTKSSGEVKHFNMNQYRRLFNSCQIPRPGMDELVHYFKSEAEGDCPSHVIVIYKGRIYRLEALHPDGGLITTAEWQKLLDLIVEDALEKGERGDDVACLTSDDRDTWAENREYLVELDKKNEECLHDIESSLFVLDLDDDCPVTPSEVSHMSLAGDLRCRWADKALNIVFFNNGSSSGICNHACYDGIVSVTTMHYLFLALVENRDNWQESMSVRPNLIKPAEMEFVIDDEMKKRISYCWEMAQKNKNRFIMTREKFGNFGKDLIQEKHQLHPDAFVQMALQLAYFKMHKRPAATYETANTRTFYNGRTETHRSCTKEAVNWCLAMLDITKTDEDRAKLLRLACDKHVQLLKNAEKNAGCDRHLFGLQVIAFESGIPTPEIFTDPSYIKSGGNGNFILSTSLTGYTPVGGGVMPMCPDGYGCFYNIASPCIWMTMSVRRDGTDQTSVHKFFKCISEVLLEMDKLPLSRTNDRSDSKSKL